MVPLSAGVADSLSLMKSDDVVLEEDVDERRKVGEGEEQVERCEDCATSFVPRWGGVTWAVS